MAIKKASKELPKVEDKQPQNYELILIISTESGDEALNATIDKVSRFITERGGTISTMDQWGKRRLAYPIHHFMEGNYVLTQFTMKPVFGKELESSLQVSEEVLRHLLIKLSN